MYPQTNRFTVVILIFFASFLAGCVGPKKVNRWVDEHYGYLGAIKPRKNDFITISSNLPFGPETSVTDREVKNVLPLIFYWRWDYTITSSLNPKIPVGTFTSAVQSYALKALKPKLPDARIELTVDSIPSTFILNNRSQMIWVVYAFGWDKITIASENKNLVVSYKIIKDNTPDKTGVVTVDNTIPVLQKTYLKRVKTMTEEYLYQYDEATKLMARKVVDKIIAEL